MKAFQTTATLLSFIFILLLTLPNLQAQPGGGRIEDRVARLKERLKLTDEQTVKVKEIYTTAQTDIQKQRDSIATGNREEMMLFAMERMKKTDAQIDSVLTVDQKKIYEEVKKEREEQMRSRWQNRGGGR